MGSQSNSDSRLYFRAFENCKLSVWIPTNLKVSKEKLFILRNTARPHFRIDDLYKKLWSQIFCNVAVGLLLKKLFVNKYIRMNARQSLSLCRPFYILITSSWQLGKYGTLHSQHAVPGRARPRLLKPTIGAPRWWLPLQLHWHPGATDLHWLRAVARV